MACPEVVLLRKHVLIMSFIGQDRQPAPKIKEAKLSLEEMTSAYRQCIEVDNHRKILLATADHENDQ